MSDRPLNATPLGRSREVTITVMVEPDASIFSVESGGVLVHADLIGRPVLSIRDLGVDESAVGATVLALLADALEGGGR